MTLSNRECPACGQINQDAARFCARCGLMLETTPLALRPGQMMDGGTFRVVRPLGKGGMGSVYLAAKTDAFDRLCVIKEVIDYFDLTDPAARLRAMERFEAEARTLGDLKHPGIPDLYAYFSEGGRNYLVMEYIEGSNLADGLTHEDDDGRIVPGGPLPLEDVLRYAIQICQVLEHMEQHRPPVVHNDVKPANIILDEHSGRAVLVDFGTAKTRYGPSPAGQPGRKQSSVYGTVGYAPPEQYRGESEPRSDVYALAATAYHLLTDDDPRDHPARFPKMGTLPADLSHILQQALAENVNERLTATQFRHELQAFLDARRSPVQPLTFPQGDAASTRQSLMDLSIKHWRYATGILRDGSTTDWLRRVLHDPVAAQAAEKALAAYPDDPDASLDAFLRALDPGILPRPRMKLHTGRLDFGLVPGGRSSTKALEIGNLRGGYLYGTVSSSAPWLKAGDGRFGCMPGQREKVPVTVDTTGLAPGTHRATLTLTPAGERPVTVPVEVRVPPGKLTVSARAVDFGTVARADRLTSGRSFVVANVGQSAVECRITGAPAWLGIAPATFHCPPGGQQKVTLVGRTRDVPRGRRHRAVLRVEAEGLPAREVRVRLAVGQPGAAGRTLRRILVTVVALGVLGGAAFGAWQVWGGGGQQRTYQRAVQAMQAGHLAEARALLAELPPGYRDVEVRLARVLNADVVAVAGGTFTMGSTTSLQARAHDVTLKPFGIDRFEVTNAQYRVFVQQTGHPPPPSWAGGTYPAGQSLHPVTGVTWDDAGAYCRWAGKRLPTEAEWERAARGDDGRYYPWGNQSPNPDLANYGQHERGPRPVGSYPAGASPYGALDVAGNVSEWTHSLYRDYPYRAGDGREADTGLEGRVYRGGSWQTPDPLATTRSFLAAGKRLDDLGFRCAR